MSSQYIEYRFINAAGQEFYEMVDRDDLKQVHMFSKMHKAVKSMPVMYPAYTMDAVRGGKSLSAETTVMMITEIANVTPQIGPVKI